MSDSAQILQGSVSPLLSSDDFLNFSETTDSFEKTLEDIREVIECRADIFMQKKEKHQQILDSQMMKLEREKNEYIKKSEDLMNNLKERKSHLMQIEHSYFNLRNKLSSEKETGKILKTKINHLCQDSKQKNAKFYKTSELYTTVINWYKDFLNIAIELDKENYNIATIMFNEKKKNFEGGSYIKLEILDKNRFKILKMNPSVEEDNNIIQKIIQRHEVILFMNKFQKHCKAFH